MVLIQQLPDLPHVGGGADEAGRDIVEALFHAEEDVVPVPLAHVGHGQPDVGDVDALVVLHGAVVFHPAADVGGIGLQHGQTDQAVIQQDGVALLHVAGQLGVSDGAAGLVAHDILRGQSELLAGAQRHRAVCEALQPNFRALGVQHGRHREVQLLPQGLQALQSGLMLRMGAVGKVEPGHVHAGPHHLAQHALPVRGRAQRANNLGFSHYLFPPFRR